MKQSKLDRPQVKQQVVKRLALGESKGSIAREVGLHPSQVSRFAKRGDIQALIEQEAFNLLEALPDAVDNVKELVKEMSTIPKNETKRRELAYKASVRVLESAGILNTTAPSHTVVNIVNRTTTMISPTIQRLTDDLQRKLMEIPNPTD